MLETFTVENKSNIFYIYFTFIKNDETYEILLFNEDIRQIVYEFNIKNPERTYKEFQKNNYYFISAKLLYFNNESEYIFKSNEATSNMRDNVEPRKVVNQESQTSCRTRSCFNKLLNKKLLNKKLLNKKLLNKYPNKLSNKMMLRKILNYMNINYSNRNI